MTDQGVPQFEVPESVRQEVRASYEQFLDRASSRAAPHLEVGRILTCHLLLQHQLNEHIEAMNPNLGRISELRRLLPVETLLVLAGGPPWRRNPVIEVLRPGMEEINKLRNQFSHQIALDITRDRLTSVYTTLRHAFPDRAAEIDNKAVVEAVQNFTVYACMGMVVWQTTERYGALLNAQVLERARGLEDLARRLLELIDSMPQGGSESLSAREP